MVAGVGVDAGVGVGGTVDGNGVAEDAGLGTGGTLVGTGAGVVEAEGFWPAAGVGVAVDSGVSPWPATGVGFGVVVPCAALGGDEHTPEDAFLSMW